MSSHGTKHAERALVDAHFDGTIAPAEERAMREHLTTCPSCHEHYRRRLILARLDPDAPSAVDRLGRGLGFTRAVPEHREPQHRAGEQRLRSSRSRKPSVAFERARGSLPLVISALALAAVLFLVLRSPKRQDDGFTSRGGVASTVESAPKINVYRVPRGGSPTLLPLGATPDAATILRSDELAFSYQAPPKATHLMIFGVDDRGRVFWFHPAWTNEAENPTAVKIEGDQRPHELREAIRHHLDGERLEIHGLFLDGAMTVREVEAAIAARGSEFGPVAVPGGTDHVVLLGVSP